MTRLTPLLTSLKTLNITYRTPEETLLSTPEALPTSEPTTPQIGYTVQESRLPILSLSCYRKVYVACLFGAGKFTTAGTLYWRMKKNGAGVAFGAAFISAGYYYTVNAYFYDVKVDDLLELSLWSSVSGSNWDYKAFQVQVTRLIILNKPRLMAPCRFTALASQPALTLGSPSYTDLSMIPCHDDRMLPSINAPASYSFLYPGDVYGMFRIYRGDYSTLNTVVVSTSTAYRPYYARNTVPTQIDFRCIRTEGQL
ncbi:MAG: hypothetical protein QW599_06260 [Nitrososphaerota archaeon]